jgi:hypothetical protein
MKQENFTGKKSLLIKFGIVYVGTIGLLVAAFLLSGHENASANEELPAFEQVRTTTVRAIDKANDLLGRHAERLRQLDGKYIGSLIDSSANRIALADINDDIHKEEVSFGETIDSLELQGFPYTSLAAAFRNVLKDHLSLSNIRVTLPSGAKRPGDRQQDLLRARKELQEKDDQIALLQRRPPSAGNDDRMLPALQADNDVVRQQLNEQQRTVMVLREQLSGLQHTNEMLNGRLNDAAGSRDAASNSLIVRNSALEKRSTDLADELRFAQVDCNLSRADGRQLIYTSKQRKDLLTDALAMLNELVRSPNAEVQRKATERLGQLKSLAATVHD